MKKGFLAALAIVGCTLISEAQISIGIKGGGSRVSQRVNSSGNESLYTGGHFRTYHAGFITDIPVAERISLQPQLLYTQKGSTLLSSTVDADADVRMNAIELPITILYKQPVSFGKLFGGGGISFSYALNGFKTQNGMKRNLYNDLSPWRREDFGFHFTAGIELSNGLVASISSQKSWLDVYKPNDVSVKNRSSSISLGYLIDWKAFKKNR